MRNAETTAMNPMSIMPKFSRSAMARTPTVSRKIYLISFSLFYTLALLLFKCKVSKRK